MQNHSYENDFYLHENETACRTHFHMKGFALRLVLKQRDKRTQKWPIRREKQTASGLGLNNSTTLIGVRAPLDFGGGGGVTSLPEK